MKSFLIPALLLVSASVCAEQRLGLSYVQTTYKDGDLLDLRPSVVAVQLEQGLFAGLSLQARLAYGFEGDEASINENGSSVTAEWKVSTLSNLLLNYRFLRGSRVSPYVVAGKTLVEIDITRKKRDGSDILRSSVSGDSGTAWGVGADVRLSERFSANLEYMQYFNKAPITIEGVSLGVNYRFSP